MLKVSKFMVSLFAAIGAIKVGCIGIDMIEKNDGDFLLGLLITSIIVAYISVSTYFFSNELSKGNDNKKF